MRLVRCDSCDKTEEIPFVEVEPGKFVHTFSKAWSIQCLVAGKFLDFCSTICKRAGPKKKSEAPKSRMGADEKLMRRLIALNGIPERHSDFLEKLARMVEAGDFELTRPMRSYAEDLDERHGR